MFLPCQRFKLVTVDLHIALVKLSKLLHREMPIFILLQLWPLNSPDLHPVDYQTGDHAGTCLPESILHSTDELKQRLIQFSCNLDQDIINMVIDKMCKRHQGYGRVKGSHKSPFIPPKCTPYELIHNFTVTVFDLFFCDWLAQMLCTFFVKYIRNVDIY